MALVVILRTNLAMTPSSSIAFAELMCGASRAGSAPSAINACSSWTYSSNLSVDQVLHGDTVNTNEPSPGVIVSPSDSRCARSVVGGPHTRLGCPFRGSSAFRWWWRPHPLGPACRSRLAARLASCSPPPRGVPRFYPSSSANAFLVLSLPISGRYHRDIQRCAR